MEIQDVKTISAKFYADPEWPKVEAIIMEHLEPLLDMRTVDMTKPAEDVKVEIKGRMLAYNSMLQFLNQAKIINNHNAQRESKNIFR